jgi:hypothetical protein
VARFVSGWDPAEVRELARLLAKLHSSITETKRTDPPEAPGMSPRLRAALPMLLDIVIPIAGYYVLHALGVDDFWALTIAGAGTAGYTIVNTVRRGRLDRLGTLVVLEIALSVVLFAVTRDPRIVLLKPSFYTALAAGYLLYTCLSGRPFTVETSRPFATEGDPDRTRAYEAAWEHSPGFRREHRLVTAVWAVLWLAESAVRVVVVLNSDISEGVLLGQVPGIVAIVAGIVFTRLRVPAVRRHVEAQLPGRDDGASAGAARWPGAGSEGRSEHGGR